MQNCSLVGNSSGIGGWDSMGMSTSGGNGGAIDNEGRAFLNGCKINSNRTGDGNGTGPQFYWNGGTGGNGGNGGGIYNAGKMSLAGCMLVSNVCGAGGAGGQPDISDGGEGLVLLPIDIPDQPSGNGGGGAGIYNAGTLVSSCCTVADNVAGDGGSSAAHAQRSDGGSGGSAGGVFNTDSADLQTCTISGNIAGNGGLGANGDIGAGNGGDGGNGGGIYNGGALNLTSCTIALNQAGIGANAGNASDAYDFLGIQPASGGQGGNGGGVFNTVSETNVIVRNSLIALNIPNIGGSPGTNYYVADSNTAIGSAGATGIGYEINGGFTSQGFNLISTGDGGTGFTNGVDGDQVGTDANPINPVLGPLQWNGGPTPTHALLPGSPAINQGFDFGIRFDQRDYPRPYLYHGIAKAPSGDGSDIGAFELQGR